MKLPLPLVLAALLLTVDGARAQPLPADAALIAGFIDIVFDAEISGAFSDPSYVKKFMRPVRVRVETAAARDREAEIARFVDEVNRGVEHLDIAMARPGERANFVVHVVGRVHYERVGREVYRDGTMIVPGHCIVRTSYSRAGIARSDAIIVSDEGDARFRRCLIEELLQGLGPLNDNADAPDSVFNDSSRLTEFGPYDRVMLNMLYDPRLRVGARLREAEPLLPAILEDAKGAARR